MLMTQHSLQLRFRLHISRHTSPSPAPHLIIVWRTLGADPVVVATRVCLVLTRLTPRRGCGGTCQDTLDEWRLTTKAPLQKTCGTQDKPPCHRPRIVARTSERDAATDRDPAWQSGCVPSSSSAHTNVRVRHARPRKTQLLRRWFSLERLEYRLQKPRVCARCLWEYSWSVPRMQPVSMCPLRAARLTTLSSAQVHARDDV